MKIKNIKEYRTYFKKEVRKSPNRNEHLISNFYIDPSTGEKAFGWFDLYHGQKGLEGYTPQEGIRNFLSGFLNMAKDSQAVYEFLQNAVDAQSSHFTMMWGKDEVDGNEYLLVANNGKMFSTENVESILNIGASTKTGDHHSIGKFGIGFKLAHRLVGKADGLDELTNQFNGPVLFSWKNDHIQQLIDGEWPEPEMNSFNGQVNENDYPWMFKILLTCFPCLPENRWEPEAPVLFDGKPASTALFSRGEQEALARWSQKLIQKVGRDTYNEGSIFFMKLGEGKARQLRDRNLRDGVKFSMGLLWEQLSKEEKRNGGLTTVQLNDEAPIERPDLQYETFQIHAGEEDYNYVLSDQEEEKQLPVIEFTIGFRPHRQLSDYFRGAPNFYLYFPLSEEVHQFNFILHSNAFDNSSSRTFLQPGPTGTKGRNERVFEVVAKRIEERLQSLLAQNTSRFLDLYAALLTSEKSTNENRRWIYNALITPVNTELKRMIPIQEKTSDGVLKTGDGSQKIVIKATEIDIDFEQWGLSNLSWFYWDRITNPQITFQAQSKLFLTSYTIFNLLENEGIYHQVNQWLNNDPNRIEQVLRELNTELPQENRKAIVQNLLHLKILEFIDGMVLSFHDLGEKQEEGYLLLHNKLSEIKRLLQKIGLITTKKDFNHYRFIDTIRSFLSNDSQLKGHTELVKLFSRSIQEETLKNLSKVEKVQIFKAFRNLNDENRPQRMRELKLFRNQAGEFVPLKQLLKPTTNPWLKRYSIHPDDNDPDITYFCKTEDIYSDIIVLNWADILQQLAQKKWNKEQVLQEIISHYKPDEEIDLGKCKKWTPFQQHIEAKEQVYYHKALLEYEEEHYQQLQEVMHILYKVTLPDQWFLHFLEQEPFFRESCQLELKAPNQRVSEEDLNILLQFAEDVNVSFFKEQLIEEVEGTWWLSDAQEKRNCYTENEKLLSYLSQYEQEKYLPLPLGKLKSAQLPQESNAVLVQEIIDRMEITASNSEQQLQFTKALLDETLHLQTNWVNKIPKIQLNVSWTSVEENELWLRFCSRIFAEEKLENLSLLHQKLVMDFETHQLPLNAVHQAQDKLIISKDGQEFELSVSGLLNEDNQQDFVTIRGFAGECISRNLLTTSQAEQLFKLERTEEFPLERFHAALDENKLLNAHQLAFVILNREKYKLDLTDYQIQTKYKEKNREEECWYQLKEEIYLPDNLKQEMLAQAYVLHDRYVELRSILHLNDVNLFQYGADSKDAILPHCWMTNTFSANSLEADVHVATMLEYLFECWNKTQGDQSGIAGWDWKEILEFNPFDHVIGQWITSEEQLPFEVLEWMGDGADKKAFLIHLGVNNDTAVLGELRAYLMGGKHPFQDNHLNEVTPAQIRNTLFGLTTAFNENKAENSNRFVLDEQDDRVALLILLQTHLITQSDADFPVLVYRDKGKVELIDPFKSNLPPAYINPDIVVQLQQYNSGALDELYEAINVLVYAATIQEYLQNQYKPLELEKEFLAGEAQEHNEHFYEKWKESFQLQLYKVPEAKYALHYKTTGYSLELGEVHYKNWHLEQRENNTAQLYYTKEKITLEQLKAELQEAETGYGGAITNLIEQRENLFSSLFNSGEELVNQVAHQAHNQNERQRFLNELKSADTIKYSHKWFMAYLGYLETFQEVEDTTALKSLSFDIAERYLINDKVSKKHFYLKGAGQLIPDNIEHCEGFELTLVFYDKKKETIKLDGVSKKGQDLLVYKSNEFKEEWLYKLPKVRKTEITFQPTINLFKKLKTAFSTEEYIRPWESLNEQFPKLELIYGPPGTGKTTELTRRITKALKTDQKRFLLLTPTNKAADVLVKKVMEKDPSRYVYRLGIPTDPELENDFFELYQSALDGEALEKVNLLATTIHRLPYFGVTHHEASKKLFAVEQHWDYIIFDEASMINLPYMMFALKALYVTNPNAQFVVAGDPQQIPPVQAVQDAELEQMDIADENIYKMLNVNSFRETEQKEALIDYPHTIDNLDTQYRSVPAIGKLYSAFSYEGLLKHHRSGTEQPAKKLPPGFRELFQSAVSFVSFSMSEEDSLFKPMKLNLSAYHMYSAILAMEIVNKFNESIRSFPEEKWTIGLVSPYKAHAMLTNKLITSLQLADHLQVHCDTIHSFQGDECDIVLFTATPNNFKFTGNKRSLLEKKYLYNVAISRARDYLWILHPEYSGKQNTAIEELKRLHAQNQEPVTHLEAHQVEKALLNAVDFINNNTYFSGHNTVNVFGELEQSYFIKASPSAIDIQLRNINTIN